MKQITNSAKKVYCGIDFHKVTSTLCALSPDGKEVEPLVTVKTKLLVQYLSNRKDWVIGIEVTGGANDMAERLKASGHEVVLINSNQFRGIGIGGKKTDQRDAIALANALRLGFIPEVHLKAKRSREIKSLLTSREHLVHARVDAINHIRGTLREYGVTISAGVESFYTEAFAKIHELKNEQIKRALLLIFNRVQLLKEEEKQIEADLMVFTVNDEKVKKLQTIPGVGPITALMMVAVVDDVSRFKNSKLFAAYLGLVPRVSASANVRMMGSITRSGSEMLRRYLIHGARAWMRYAPKEDINRIWAEKLKERRGMNKATVALAHRIARICFAVLRDDTTYKPRLRKSEVSDRAA
ncbi:MAG: IS110 family RNA-guided transposase [Pseudobdellovibrionaceae bacterium]